MFRRVEITVAGLLASTSLVAGLVAGLAAGTAEAQTAPLQADVTPQATATEPTTPNSVPVDIIVTAQRRSSTVQSTPISITAVGGAELAARGIASFASLAQSAPGVSLKSEGPSQTEIELRGMTSSGGNSPTVGFYLDDIPLTAPSAAQNGKVVIDPSLYDLNRIEILRGPQGTLYGSGSMGGTVRLIANQPDATRIEGSAQATLSGTEGGGFNHAVNAMINLPLVEDRLALRIVGSENFTSGWIDRIVAGAGNTYPTGSVDGSTRGNVAGSPVIKDYHGSNASQTYGFRATLLWKPTDALSITPMVLYQHSKQDGVSAYDSDPGTLAHYQPFDVAEPLTDRIIILGLTVNYAFDAFDITSSSAYWNRRSTQVEDGSEDFNNPNTGATYASNNGLPNPGYYGPNGSGIVSGTENDPSRQFSQELRIASKGNHRLSWVGGLFYSDYHMTWNFDGRTSNPSAYLDLGTFDRATTTSWFLAYSPTHLKQYAAFAEGTFAITPTLKFTAGARYYKFDYHFTSSITGWGSGLGAATPSLSGLITHNEQGVSPKFNLSYEPNSNLTLYATAARGFRPGGGNAQYPVTGPYWSAVYAPYNFTGNKWPTSYDADSVWSYEVGEKLRLLDRRLTINGSVYYEDWDHIQLLALPGDWQLNINGNKAKIYGGEIETRGVLGAGFELKVSASYTHARVDSGPHWQIVPADRLSDVAPVTANAILSYSHDIGGGLALTASGENGYTGKRYSLAFPFGYSLNGRYILLPDYDLTNLRVGLRSEKGWSASLFVDNVFNKHAQLESLFQETLPAASFNRIVTNQPLTGGIDLSFHF
ncbi:TonB-dependent receptor [uncultured Sphingomonas sp.]|uniref:TonB-dependent receptor n=1 Tax=uncultured Sphingomonas sp. TaxID=158754 RepID=UPI0035C94F7D